MAARLVADKRPTAVFAMSDDMAFGAIRAVADAGLRVPDDISVIGFDDHELADAFQLTTVRQHVARHGAIAARLLVDHINGAPVDHVSVPTDLVVRSTTAAAPNRAGSAPENVSGTCAIVHTDRRDGQVSSTVRTFGLIGRR
jgi:LacI family repressor for deo operon, udp, cdd, tsx, nupC, and nupG